MLSRREYDTLSVSRSQQLGYRRLRIVLRSAQVADLAAAMRWMSKNSDVLGFETCLGSGIEDSHQQRSLNAGAEQPDDAGCTDGSHSLAHVGKASKAPSMRTFLVGHSSGAHVGLFYLTARAKRKEEVRNRAQGQGERLGQEQGVKYDEPELEVEGFIGLSGVYDITQHYAFESWR